MTMKVAVADFDTNSSPYIEAGAKLIINVPSGFTATAVTSSTGFSSTSVITFPDGSAQVLGTVQNRIGDQNSAEAVVLEFTTTPPSVASEKLFHCSALLYGVTNTWSDAPSGFSVGAIAESVVQVVP
jgi:hypothetical protein